MPLVADSTIVANASIATISTSMHAMASPPKRVYLLGLDFGSTTSSALLASAQLSRSATGRMQFNEIRVEFRGTPIFTPFINGRIDISSLTTHIHAWLNECQIANNRLFSGGSIITGLAAQAENAEALTTLITQLLGDSIIATADEPCLESWLAFMGACAALSRHHTDVPILNLDIGGGTTNVALGVNGEVLATGCYFIGARHFQCIPSTYQLSQCSHYGLALLKALHIHKRIGETFTEDERTSIIAFYVSALEAIVLNQHDFFACANSITGDDDARREVAHLHQQVALHQPSNVRAKITFSGGVGELLYQYAAGEVSGETLSSTTYFGDFGIDLARAIASSPILSADLHDFMPEHKGRATVFGLTLHSTEISGQTLYLPAPHILPLRHLPIVAKLAMTMLAPHWHNAFTLATSHAQGACIQITALPTPFKRDHLQQLVQMIKQHVANSHYPATQALVILVETNIGLTLGHYLTDWGQSMQNLIVIDEVPLRHAQFVNIGRLQQQMLPVSFYGMH